MGQTNSRGLNKTNEDQVTITIEESSSSQSIPPQVEQLRLDGDKLVYRAKELQAEAALLRNDDPPNEVKAQQLDEEYKLEIEKAKEKYGDYLRAAYGHDSSRLNELCSQAFALINQADQLMRKKRKRPSDFYKPRDLYKQATDKYWLLKRDINVYLVKVRNGLRNQDEPGKEQEPEQIQTPKYVELMEKLQLLETRLGQIIKSIDDFKERQVKPLIFIFIIVIIIIIIFITYFCL